MDVRGLDRAAREDGIAVVAAVHRAAAAEPMLHAGERREHFTLMRGTGARTAMHLLQSHDVGLNRGDDLGELGEMIFTPGGGVALDVVRHHLHPPCESARTVPCRCGCMLLRGAALAAPEFRPTYLKRPRRHATKRGTAKSKKQKAEGRRQKVGPSRNVA